VSVHRDSRDSKCVAEDDIRRLSTDTRERHEILEIRRDISAKLIAQTLRHRLQRRRLLPEETRGSNAHFQFFS
jgi:hypothetical protein